MTYPYTETVCFDKQCMEAEPCSVAVVLNRAVLLCWEALTVSADVHGVHTGERGLLGSRG